MVGIDMKHPGKCIWCPFLKFEGATSWCALNHEEIEEISKLAKTCPLIDFDADEPKRIEVSE